MQPDAVICDLDVYLLATPSVESTNPRVLIVRLTSGAGLDGWGEAPTSWRPAEIPARRDWLLSALAGRRLFDVEELLLSEVLRFAPLRAAVETAVWDLIGRTLGVPLCSLWGGHFRRHIPLAAALPTASDEDTARMARDFADSGYFVHQLSATGDVALDVSRCGAWRQAAGSRATLRVDGRNRYDTAGARELCRKLETADIQWLLDPIASADLTHMASLARQTSVPAAAGSAVGGARDVAAVARCEVVRHLDVRLERVGGLTATRKCAAAAEAFGLAMSLSTLAPFGVAAAALLHVAAATANLSQAALCPAAPREHACLIEPIRITDGSAHLPDEPGLGVHIDRAKLENASL